MLGILGSGFGLYGYLPAAVALGFSPILVPARYQNKFLSRVDLKKFINNISWIDTDQDLIKMATTLVISRRPIDQCKELPNYLSQRQLKKIIFEKPLAIDPVSALKMLDMVEASGKQCNAGFTFRFTPWAALLQHTLNSTLPTKKDVWVLQWHFLAHHFSANFWNWKRDHRQGGGALRFYGIHVIALLAEFGYTEVVSSEVLNSPNNESYSAWHAIFRGQELPEFRVEVDSCSDKAFFILRNLNKDANLYEDNDPFKLPVNQNHEAGIDPRYIFLQEVLSEQITPDQSWPKRLLDGINLWALVEIETKILSVKK
jgi:hypothetical protein